LDRKLGATELVRKLAQLQMLGKARMFQALPNLDLVSRYALARLALSRRQSFDSRLAPRVGQSHPEPVLS
jgi:hypothetical protein